MSYDQSIHRNSIAGEWLAGNTSAGNINPSDTRDVIGVYTRATAQQIEMTIEAATVAQSKWAATTPQRRFDVLDAVGNEILARQQDLGDLLAREEGKTLREAVGEVVPTSGLP